MNRGINVSPNATDLPLVEIDRRHHIHAYAEQRSVRSKGAHVFVGGQGVHVTDLQGRQYLDALSGMWCVGLGYGDPEIARVAETQIRTLAYCPVFGDKTSDITVRLSGQIAGLRQDKLQHLFFVNSGSEANDCAAKLCWYYFNARGQSQKKTFVTFDRAYHGSTVAAASLTALPHMHKAFDLPAIPVLRVPSPDTRNYIADRDASEELLVDRMVTSIISVIEAYGPNRVAAFFAEPVLGAGGLIIPPRTFFPKLQAYLRSQDILLVADEIITGFGRTGEMFGSDVQGMKPDITTFAKNLSSGYAPIAAVLCSDAISAVIDEQSSVQGTFAMGMTYSGHPLASAIASECLNRYSDPSFLPTVRQRGTVLGAALAQLRHGAIVDRRGLGLLGAVDLAVPGGSVADGPSLAKAVVQEGLEQRVILRALGNTVIFCPPYISTETEVADMVDRFDHALQKVCSV